MVAVSKVWRCNFAILRLKSPGAGLQRPLVTASTGILPSLTALVTSSLAKLVCLSPNQMCERVWGTTECGHYPCGLRIERLMRLQALKELFTICNCHVLYDGQ